MVGYADNKIVLLIFIITHIWAINSYYFSERYRDLIEAADTIYKMKQSAENVMQSISRMQDMCQGLKSMPKTAKKSRPVEKSR